MPNKCVLVDVDDVLCDFKNPAIDIMRDLFGIEIDLSTFEHWDLFTAMTEPQQAVFYELIGRPGYCYSLEVLPGAKEGIERLRQEGEVVIVTRPVMSPTWVYERTNWLIDNFGFNVFNIISTAGKHHVRGHALVDDNPENIARWQEHNPLGDGLLWSLPNTENMSEMDRHRVRTWDEVLTRVREL